ncbi:FecR domain-containing protein [Christensenellaceae bacterium OttesenSCG-928-M15]|nr:FecR domain-containing protein [Christensenellaceae bacterium OttesenSCG-928-M15]
MKKAGHVLTGMLLMCLALTACGNKEEAIVVEEPVAAAAPLQSVVIAAQEPVAGNVERTGIVVHMEGEAFVKTGAETIPLSVGAALVQGDTVSTGEQSSVTVLFENDKFLYIAPQTVFSLTSLNGEEGETTILALKAGTLISDVQKPLAEADVYEVHSLELVMSIRGTIASVSTTGEEVSVLLFEGSADVAQSGGENRHLVKQGFRLEQSGEDVQLDAAQYERLNAFEQEFIDARPDKRTAFEQSVHDALLTDGRIKAEQGAENKSGQSEDSSTREASTGDDAGKAASSYIGASKAKSIALAHAGVEESAVKIVKQERYQKKNTMLYDVIFLSSTRKYRYEIDAATGDILAHYITKIGGASAGEEKGQTGAAIKADAVSGSSHKADAVSGATD